MHDSVKNICERLNGEFSDEESVAVLVWTKRDVMDCAGCMEITEEEAGRVLARLETRAITVNTVQGRTACVTC